MARAYLGLGSNLGDRRHNIERALAALRQLDTTTVSACAGMLESAPLGPAGQNPYLNSACCLRTRLTPRELLHACQRIETQLGRPPPAARVRWGPRVIDLDLLLYDNLVLHAEDLEIPHPRMCERGFVLAPLCEIEPAAVHPETGLTCEQLLARLGRVGAGFESSPPRSSAAHDGV